ncbi:MAG: GMC family oxidoreductase N-terminal domain-containing protein [Pseudomonadota bacterium]
MKGPLEFDYIIVGAGASGCVLAARLSEDPKVRVGLFEAGGPDDAMLLHIPGANVVTGTDPRYNWAYQTEPNPGLGGRALYWAQGRVVGGSGAINGMMYMRGHRSDYDRWEKEGCAGWGYDGVLPFFRKAETNERGESELHGGNGPLQVSAGRSTAPVCDLFLQAASTYGLPLTDDLNQDMPQGFGHVDMTIGGGRRSSTAAAYLRPARGRSNLSLLVNAPTLKVTIAKGEARGIEFLHNGERRTAIARHGVILAGGAVNSPQLLMLSGIGDATELTSHGIKVEADRPQVGRNLQNHPMYRLMYTTTKPVSAYNHVRPLGALKAGAHYLFARGGVLSRGLFPTSGFFHAVAGDPATEIQVCMAPALVIRRKPGLFGILPSEHGFTLLLNHGSPFSRGEIRLKSADPLAHAAIFSNFFSDPRDIRILARGARKARDIVHCAPLGPMLGRELQPSRPLQTDEDFANDIRATATTHYHPVGTCRMGDDADAVVDPQLRVRGVDRLYVADASIMPTLINGNTYAASIMIGEKAAHIISGA